MKKIEENRQKSTESVRKKIERERQKDGEVFVNLPTIEPNGIEFICRFVCDKKWSDETDSDAKKKWKSNHLMNVRENVILL